MADEIEFLPLGAIIKTFQVAGVNIVQGFPTQQQYVDHNKPYFGETIGRVANRISGASLRGLRGGENDDPLPLAANNGPNTLHGGRVGWGKRIWKGPEPVGLLPVPGLDLASGGESVRFAYTSPDGEEGFPGEVRATVTYTTGKADDGALVLAIEYEAELAPGTTVDTVINMTNHSYFNLTGGPTIEGTELQLCTSSHLPVDETAIPTGGPEPFPGLDPAAGFTWSAGAGGTPNIDHCFVVDPTSPPSSCPVDTRSRPLTRLVSARHPDSGVRLEVHSTEPAFQFYTGKFTDVPAVEGAPARGAHSAFCVEPSRFVNAANVDAWRGQVLLRPGQKYGARTVYKAWKV